MAPTPTRVAVEYASEDTPSATPPPEPARRNARLGCLVVVLVPALVLTVVVWAKVSEQSAARVEREHGVRLPPSARAFVCRGDAWTGFLDRGAFSSFEVDAADLPQFLAQLRPHGSGIYFGFTDETGAVRYDCHSPTGDRLYVLVHERPDERPRIELSTDWD
jgi:hypothetical protein